MAPAPEGDQRLEIKDHFSHLLDGDIEVGDALLDTHREHQRGGGWKRLM